MSIMQSVDTAHSDIYYSTICVVPFHCPLTEQNGDTTVFLHKPEKLMMHEVRFNQLYKMLELLGWNDCLSYVFIEGGSVPLIRIIINPELVMGTSIASTGIVVGMYSLATGRVSFAGILQTQNLVKYYSSMHKDLRQVKSAIDRNAQKGYSIEDFVGYLEYLYRDKKEGTTLPFSHRLFVKNWLMSIIAESVNYGFKNGYMEALMGDLTNWHPYFLKDISLAHLEFLFTHHVYVMSAKESKFGLMMNYMNAWNGTYRWSPEEMEEIAKLPIEWVKNIYPIEKHQ